MRIDAFYLIKILQITCFPVCTFVSPLPLFTTASLSVCLDALIKTGSKLIACFFYGRFDERHGASRKFEGSSNYTVKRCSKISLPIFVLRNRARSCLHLKYHKGRGELRTDQKGPVDVVPRDSPSPGMSDWRRNTFI